MCTVMRMGSRGAGLVVGRATEDHGDVGLVQRDWGVLCEDSCFSAWCVKEGVCNLHTSDILTQTCQQGLWFLDTKAVWWSFSVHPRNLC